MLFRSGREAIDKWCMKYVGRELPITDKKDHLMTKLYDDKAVNPKDLSAYGTSEGVTKSWDIRGRSRKRVGELLKQGGWKTKYASTEWAQFHIPSQPGVLVVNRYFDRWQHKDDAGKRLASGDSLASLADYMENLHGKQMQAYGTSEGVKKSWDARRQMQDMRTKAFQEWNVKAREHNGQARWSTTHEETQKIGHHEVMLRIQPPRHDHSARAQFSSGVENWYLNGKRLGFAKVADVLDKEDMQAYGTSEGLKKAWDSRGRGKNTMPERGQKVRAKKTVLLPSGATLYIGRPHAPQDRPLTPAKQGVYPVGSRKSPGGYNVKVSKGRLWPEQAYWKNGLPQAGLHPLKGEFTEANRQLNPKDYTIEPRKGAGLGMQSTQAYAALDHAGDRGATVFIEHHGDGTGKVVEFNHDSAGRLQYGRKLLPSLGDTQVVRFNSGQAQSTFLRQRYGIDKKEE